MKIKLTMVCGYVESDYEEDSYEEDDLRDYEEEIKVDYDTTEEELEELAKEFFWEKFHGSYGYEIIEE